MRRPPSAPPSNATEIVGLNPFISKKLDDGSHLDLLIHRQANLVQTVDFTSNTVRQVFSNNLYTIFLTSSINKNHHVVCLFPTHKSETKQVLYSQKFFALSSFNKSLNSALEESLDSQVKMAICYGNHIFICKGIVGTVYILWASHVTRTNAASVANTLFQNVPVLINMDGQARVRSVYILKANVTDESDLDRLPVTVENPKLLFNKDNPLFVCEVKPLDQRNPPSLKDTVTTLSKREAMMRVTAPSRTPPSAFQQEKNPFISSVDMEEVYASEPDGGTPRTAAHMYMRDVRIGSKELDEKTPPIIQSEDDARADDPFEEVVV